MAADISGIAKSVLQARANLKAESPDKDSRQSITVSFMEMMNQSSFSANANVSSRSDAIEIRVEDGKVSKTAYDTCPNPVRTIAVKEDTEPEQMLSEAAEPLEEYEAEIRKILEEELGVTEEEISDAMQELGMSFLDCRNLQDLTTLVQKLTGEDVGTLFLSEPFQNVVEQVTVLTEALCAELGISKEEFQALCEAWEQLEVDMPEAMPQNPDILQEEEVLPEVNVSNKEILSEQVSTVVVQEEEPSQENRAAVTENQDAGEDTVVVKRAEVKVQEGTDSNTGEQQSSDQSANTKPDVPGTAFLNQQTVNTEEFILPQETAQPYTDQVNVMDIIDQLARTVRLTISAETTSLEMQLNPEHLGKIYLNISEKEGAVRAQIAAQNEAVKEALETQIVELRQSLHQQGIKVDAIEVTVATHEFEQNLEQNARQEEQMQQQADESHRQNRRNLNMSELDELSGLMSEEEALVAKIMRDNGNQVDMTA